MKTFAFLRTLTVATVLTLIPFAHGEESVSFEVAGELGHISGNMKVAGHFCDGWAANYSERLEFTYDFTFNGATVSSNLLGCCGIHYGTAGPHITNEIAGAGTYHSVVALTVPGEICGTSFYLTGLPPCFDQTSERFPATWPTGDRPSVVQWVTTVERNSNSLPVAVWSVKDRTGTMVGETPAEGHYQLVADGMSAAIATVVNTEEDPTFQFTGDSLGCTLTETASGAVLTAGTNYGTVQVTAVIDDTDPCLQRDFYFDLLPPCSTCVAESCPPLAVTAGNSSVDVLINLGPGRDGLSPAYLQVKAEEPSVDLGTPVLLSCNFIQPDLQKTTNSSGWLRQLRVIGGFVDVLTNSTSSYSIEFYNPTNLIGLTNGLYVFTNSPDRSVTIELVGGDTNHVRITESEGSVMTDYYWETNGWALETGGGLRRETKMVSVDGDTRTETTTIKQTGGSVERELVEVWQTNSFGDRLIQEVFGAGATARTNTYSYNTNGLLEQVVRWDGSWDIYHYDSLRRQIEHYSPFLNSAPTTNAALCRRVSSTYTNSVVPDSGDEADFGKYTPRRVIEYVKGTEISRRYTVVKSNEMKQILCPDPQADWDDTANQATTTYLRMDSAYLGQPDIISHADGTMTFYTYSQEALPGTSTPIYEKVATKTGEPNGGVTDIVDGVKVETWEDSAGRVRYMQTSDIESGLLTSREIYTYDEEGRVTFINHLDGTMESRTYDCCHLLSTTDRAGTATSYTYDALDRQLTMTRDGVTTSNVWNSAGDQLEQYRIGTNGNTIRLIASAYDTAGRRLSTTNALDEVMEYEETGDSSGGLVRTTTNADESTVIETYARDGAMLMRNGTAVFDVRYTNGVASVGGYDRFYSEEIRLQTNGNDSAEWVRTVADGLGRTIQTQFPDSATNSVAYNAAGQMESATDADGVTTLYAYNNLGELEYVALDVDEDGSIDLDETDRVTRTVTDVTSSATYGAAVRLTQTYVYASDNDTTATLLSERADALYSQQTWVSADGLTSSSVLSYLGSGATEVTRTSPDGTKVVETFQSGRPLSVTVSNATEGVLRQETYGYDQHNRRSTVTDLRTGTTSFTFDDLDRVLTVTTPVPGAGQSAQVTTLVYDEMGRVERTQAPDGLWTTNEFQVNGPVKNVTGARVYPVAYTYDYAGRVETMKTWQDYAGDSGTAVTTWKYDERGFLTNKLDNASEGPSYTYTDAGRLATRAWARGVSTTYDYNEAGDLENIDYSDGTPDVDYTYDRQGRPSHIEGATTNDYSFTAHGLLLSEDVLNASWNYISETRFGYDALRRRSALTNLSLSVVQDYGYDAASRLDTVSTAHGGVTALAGYSYLENSPLVETLTLQHGGTTRLTTDRAYDNLNRLTSISSDNTTLPEAVSFAYAYNAANQRTGVTNTDASYWLYGYDRLGQVTNGWRYWDGGSNLLGQTFNYQFDDIGNRTSTQTGGDDTGANLRTATYSANLLNQYTNRSVPGYLEVSGTATNSAEVRVNGYVASRQGDYFRREVTVNNSSSALAEWQTSVATNANGTTTVARLSYVPQTPEAFTYDEDGNLTSDGLWDYTWDGENRLIRIQLQPNTITDSVYWQRVECDYDYLSRRLRKRSYGWDTNAESYALTRSIRYFYDGWNLVGQVDEVTGIRLSWMWGTDLSGTLQGAGGVGGLLAMTVHNGPLAGTYFYGYDGNGNVAALIDAADGSEAARYEYGPFGELITATGPLANINPFRFSTKYQDEETGLLYYGFRYFMATTGRWMSRDPIGERGGKNVYAFVANRSVGNVDPSGLNLYAIDGTGNDETASSNVSKFVSRYIDGTPKHYYPGPGNPTDGVPVIGLTSGAGSASIVDAVVKQICEDLKADPNIHIDIVGFSRGAAIANQVATKLAEDGCRCYNYKGRRRTLVSQTKPRIRFLGLFDPVYSFPWPITPFWNDDTIPANVDNATLIFASDETRKTFRPSVLVPASPDSTVVSQRWFPGVHSDVGGHKDFNSWIGDWTLRYMVDQAVEAGVTMDAVDELDDRVFLPSEESFQGAYAGHPGWFEPTSMWLVAPFTPTTWLND